MLAVTFPDMRSLHPAGSVFDGHAWATLYVSDDGLVLVAAGVPGQVAPAHAHIVARCTDRDAALVHAGEELARRREHHGRDSRRIESRDPQLLRAHVKHAQRATSTYRPHWLTHPVTEGPVRERTQAQVAYAYASN